MARRKKEQIVRYKYSDLLEKETPESHILKELKKLPVDYSLNLHLETIWRELIKYFDEKVNG